MDSREHHNEDIRNIEGFERLFRTYYQPLCNYVFTFLKETEASEEVVQELFFKLWQRRLELSIQVSWKSYLYQAARNESLNVLKHLEVRDRYKEINDQTRKSQEQVSVDVMESQEIQQRVAEAINELPEQRQRIFRMSRFEEKRYREIADELNISVKTVENQMGKALAFLREKLADLMVISLFVMEFLFGK